MSMTSVKSSLPVVVLALLIARPLLAETCSFTLSSNGQSFTNGGGPGSVDVTASPFFGCAWNAVSDANWITNISISLPSVDVSSCPALLLDRGFTCDYLRPFY